MVMRFACAQADWSLSDEVLHHIWTEYVYNGAKTIYDATKVVMLQRNSGEVEMTEKLRDKIKYDAWVAIKDLDFTYLMALGYFMNRGPEECAQTV